MTSRPPSSSSARAGTTSRGNPTPHNTIARSRSHSSSRAPPQAPKASRRPPTTESSSTTSLPPNPPFALSRATAVPRATWTKADDILGPPDSQACPFAKTGLRVIGSGTGGYGELEGWLDWPPELYANERSTITIDPYPRFLEVGLIEEATIDLLDSLKSKVDKLKEDEWMYASTDTLFTRRT